MDQNVSAACVFSSHKCFISQPRFDLKCLMPICVHFYAYITVKSVFESGLNIHEKWLVSHIADFKMNCLPFSSS